VIDRNITTALSLALDLFPAVLLTGARQTGKTTLARWLWPDAPYISLDDPAQASAANLEPGRFLSGRPEPLILDEIQYAPGLLPHLRRAIDEDRRPGRFFIAGAQTPDVMTAARESLAGQAALFSLPPLCLDEVVTVASGPIVSNFLWRGGFPELWQRPELDRDLWLGTYMATYLERDVRQVLNVGDLRGFDRLLRAAALRAGQLLSYTDLARDSGIAPNTARRWLAVLEASHQVFLLKPYPRQRKKRLIKAPKLYFTDTGLLCFLLGIRSADDLPGHALWGAVWENFVLSEARKRLSAGASQPTSWFWRTANGDEVDLLLEVRSEAFVAVECKAAERVTAADLKGVTRLAEEYGPASIVHARVACRAEEAYALDAPIDGSSDHPIGARIDARAVPLSGPGGLLAELAR
jgi:predicted AAA+ superfamily ATPase